MLDLTAQNLPFIFAAIAATIVGVVAVAVLWLSVSYLVTDPQLAALKAHLRGKYRLECLPPSALSDANEAAEQRRQFLSSVRDISHPAEFPQSEIREFPPGTEATGSRGEFSPTDAVGQMVRIRWQFDKPELLLLERVVDTAVGIVDRVLGGAGARVSSGLLGAVRLEPIKSTRGTRDIFPWTVILETNYPEVFRSEFERLRSWLAIGIDFDKPNEFMRYGLCKTPGGQLGEVGGLLNIHSQSFLMTCAHVLSGNCQSLVVKGDPTGQGQQPDAALIQTGNPCFPRDTQSPSRRAPATRQDIGRCHRREDTARYANTRHKSVRGYLYATLGEFPIDGVVYRFPHEAVVPVTRFILRIFPWPPGSGLFSEEGDSGSWILAEKSGCWIGMLVGGDRFTRISYVADGGSLLDFFELELVRRGHVIGRGTTVPLALE